MQVICDLERFWSKVNRSIGCWEWTASKMKKGYGYFYFNNCSSLAHRVSWILTYGEIPDGLYVLHKCDNRKCVRPDHLFLGTQKQNIDDCIAKKRKTNPPKNKKIKDDDILFIRNSDRSCADLGREYGVSREQIRKIKNGTSRITMNNLMSET